MTSGSVVPRFDDLQRAAARLHLQNRRFVLAVTGGGSETISALFTTPGASATMLEAIVPYSQASLVDLIGATPDQFCSAQTARSMAAAAWQRARSLEVRSKFPIEGGSQATGFAATCSLATGRVKRGAHRAWAAITDLQAVTVHGLLLSSSRSRSEEERLVAAWMLNAASERCGIEERIELPLLADESVERFEQRSRGGWSKLMTGELDAVLRDADDALSDRETQPGRVLFPGSFNPLHEGHRLMAAAAEKKLGRPVEWEIAVANVDKPPLDYLAMDERLAQFGASEPVWFTRFPKFVDKAKLFREPVFVVGVDTIRRIGDPRYYQNDPAQRDAEIGELARRGVRFLVFPRVDGAEFIGLADLTLPPALRSLCEGVEASEFRCDVSSSELRRRATEEG